METLLYGLAALACPVGMGVMMWMMMRGQCASPATGNASPVVGADRASKIATLRAEIEQLKADRTARGAGGR